MLKNAIVLGILLLSFQSFANADNIGYLDSQLAMTKYKKFISEQKKWEKKRDKLKKEIEKKQKKLEEAEDKNRSEEDLIKMKEQFDKELNPKIEQLQQEQRQQITLLRNNIMESAKEVAKSYGIDVILEKQVVLNGGFDLTNLVIDKLNK